MESVCCSNPKRSPEVSTAMVGVVEAVEGVVDPVAGVAGQGKVAAVE